MSVLPEKLPRCCRRHDDWVTLGEHLVADFPGIAVGDLLRDLVDARLTTERLGLDPAEALEIAELIVRHTSMLATGQLPDAARLDPQNHWARQAQAQMPTSTRTDPSDPALRLLSAPKGIADVVLDLDRA